MREDLCEWRVLEVGVADVFFKCPSRSLRYVKLSDQVACRSSNNTQVADLSYMYAGNARGAENQHQGTNECHLCCWDYAACPAMNVRARKELLRAIIGWYSFVGLGRLC